MPQDFTRTVELLEQDVTRTLGGAHIPVVRAAAQAVEQFALPDPEVKLVEDVQQFIHDTFLDTTWPACPRHTTHPLWYGDGAWWCTQDRVIVASLGELPERWRHAG